eukprot:8670985-Pyramimonas_sp.AAC.1
MFASELTPIQPSSHLGAGAGRGGRRLGSRDGGPCKLGSARALDLAGSCKARSACRILRSPTDPDQ